MENINSELEDRISELASAIKNTIPNYIEDTMDDDVEAFDSEVAGMAGFMILNDWTDEERNWLLNQFETRAAQKDYNLTRIITSYESFEYLRDTRLRDLFAEEIPLIYGLFEDLNFITNYLNTIADISKNSQNPGLTARKFFETIRENPDFFSEIEGGYSIRRNVFNHIRERVSNTSDIGEDVYQVLEKAIDEWNSDGVNASLEYINTNKSLQKLVTDDESFEAAVFNLITQPLFKKRIYQNADSQDKGIGIKLEIPQSFISLTDPKQVYEGLQQLVGGLDSSTPLFSAISSTIRREIGMPLKELSYEDVLLYSDQLTDIVMRLGENRPRISGNSGYQIIANESTKMRDGSIGFQFLSRTEDELRLGDLTGDCTARDGINSFAIYGWISDPTVQILKLYDNGKFMGKMHFMLGDVTSRQYNGPVVLLDAMEFIPQAREVETYRKRATAAFEAGLNKIEQISQSMQRSLYLNPVSNSDGARNILLGRYGSTTSVMFNKLGSEELVKSLLEFEGYTVDHVPYYVQSLGENDNQGDPRGRPIIDKIERLINEYSISHPNEPFVTTMKSGDMTKASGQLMDNWDIGTDVQRLISESETQLYMPEVLQRLYSRTGASGKADLIKV